MNNDRDIGYMRSTLFKFRDERGRATDSFAYFCWCTHSGSQLISNRVSQYRWCGERMEEEQTPWHWIVDNWMLIWLFISSMSNIQRNEQHRPHSVQRRQSQSPNASILSEHRFNDVKKRALPLHIALISKTRSILRYTCKRDPTCVTASCRIAYQFIKRLN